MDNRRLLAHSEVHRPFAGSDLFRRIGGRATVDALIDRLYARVEVDAALRPLFGRDLGNEREAQKRFFTEWLGGEAEYSDSAHFPLKHRHDLVPITRALAERWLAHFRHALDEAVPDLSARAAIDEKATVLALALVNESGTPSALRARSHGMCLRYEPGSESFTLARRGDAAGLRALLRREPDLLASVPIAASLLNIAAAAGRGAVIELLLDSGVDVNKPSPIGETLIFLTALCAARGKRKKEIEALLLRRGAKEDIFTHAFLGDLEGLRDDLDRDSSSSQAIDPAVDALQITPVHHAVVGERGEALGLLLSRAAETNEPLVGGARALRDAAERQNVAMVEMLLARGASARSIGAGRWVLHPDLAPMLSRAGARVEPTGGWIGASCTGNQGRKDHPEYVAALLRYGARVDDKRAAGQASDGGRATALHYASKAGFVKTIALLLEHGADPTARDDNGLTPLDWLQRAAKSIDREAVRSLLLRRPRAE
ncbi:MAG TPA: ankyrin repeat domain-containing protein [Polyangia bacterium]|nr:ankyrin repeat domain-containing protein [Polyangia bacterium]